MVERKSKQLSQFIDKALLQKMEIGRGFHDFY